MTQAEKIVVPAHVASVARDLLGEATTAGMTPAAFLVEMFQNPLDLVLERSLDGLTRDGERRLLRALRHRDSRRRQRDVSPAYTNAAPDSENPWYEVFGREMPDRIALFLSRAREDGVMLRIRIRTSGETVSSVMAVLYADPEEASVDGAVRSITAQLGALGSLFQGQVRVDFQHESGNANYGSMSRTIVHGFMRTMAVT